MTLRAEDREFLREYMNFVCLSHPIAAIAFHRAAVDAESVAVLAEGRTRRLDAETAKQVATHGNTAALVQTYVVARLLAELAAAIEDLGALLDAVRYRDRKGILNRYIGSEPAQVAELWDMIIGGTPVDALLRLPALESIDPEPPATIKTDYETLARVLPEIGAMYRTRSGAVPVVSGEEGAPTPDDVNILTSIVEEGVDVTGATLVDAYNKIKHRFTVIDDLQRLGRALKEGGRRGAYVRYPREPAKAEVLFMNIMTVAAAAGEVAALVTWLDELGLLTSGA